MIRNIVIGLVILALGLGIISYIYSAPLIYVLLQIMR